MKRMQCSNFTRPIADRSPLANKLLWALPVEDQRRILSCLTAVPLTFRQALYKDGEAIREVYFPCGGALSLTKTMEDGGTAEVATIGNEGMVGTSVFFGDEHSHGRVIVQVGADAGHKMPVPAFLAEMDVRGAFYNRVIRYHQALTVQIMQTTACNALHNVEQRCCRWLLTTRDRAGADDLKLTQEFLAVMLGVRRPTVTIVVGVLEKAGLISNRRGFINILDRAGLEAASCECYATVRNSFARLLPAIDAIGLMPRRDGTAVDAFGSLALSRFTT